MSKDDIARVMRHDLDEKLKKWVSLPEATPKKGWINALRVSMNMSLRQLARRLNIEHSGALNFERNEARGTIQLNTLRRAAQALNCKLIYALVPEHSVERTYRDRLRFVAECKIEMTLKPDKIKGKDIDLLAETMAERIKPKEAWTIIAPMDILADIADPDSEEDRLASKRQKRNSDKDDYDYDMDEEALAAERELTLMVEEYGQQRFRIADLEKELARYKAMQQAPNLISEPAPSI